MGLRMLRQFRMMAGLILVAVGLVGLLLPIVPGIPLLIAGVALVGTNHRWIRPVLNRLEKWRASKKEEAARSLLK